MNPLLKFALLSEHLYRESFDSITPESWLGAVDELWKEGATDYDMTRHIVPGLVRGWDIKLDHVGALVVETTDTCLELLAKRGYADIKTRQSVIMAQILGVPTTIVEGRAGPYRVEFFCPERRGLFLSRLALVQSWGKLGYGVHVGFAAPSRDLAFDTIKGLCRCNFVAPNWVSEVKALEGQQQLVCYMDGFIERQRIRVEVCWC